MMPNPRTKRILFSLLIAHSLWLTTGCLSIDYTPLRQQPSFQKTERILARLDRGWSREHPAGPLQIGTARIELTPRAGLPLAGYGARTSTGILDPIMARALAISDGRETVVILSLDLLAVTDDFFDSVFKKVHAAIPLSEENLLVAATHTHSGPGALGKRFWEVLAAGPFNADFFEQTTDRAATAVIESYRGLRPAVMAHGHADAADRIQNRMIKDGPTDPDLSFLIFKTPDRKTLAYLINFSAHPTLLRSTNRLLSGDFPAAVSRALEKYDGKDNGRREGEREGQQGILALYTSGAVADQRARPPEGKNVYERTERMGRELARRILAAEDHLSFESSAEVSGRAVAIDLPPPQIKVNPDHRLPVWMGRTLLNGTTRLQAVRIGRTVLLGVPCDLGSEIGLALKQSARTKGLDAMIVGFANAYIGYVIPGKYYASPAYAAFMSFNGPYMEDYTVFVLEKLLDGLRAVPAAPDR